MWIKPKNIYFLFLIQTRFIKMRALHFNIIKKIASFNISTEYVK